MSDPYVLKNGVFILKGGKAGSGVPLESHVIPHENTSVGAELDELSQNLTTRVPLYNEQDDWWYVNGQKYKRAYLTSLVYFNEDRGYNADTFGQIIKSDDGVSWGNSNITINETNINYHWQGAANGNAYFTTQNAVNISNYQKIYVKGSIKIGKSSTTGAGQYYIDIINGGGIATNVGTGTYTTSTSPVEFDTSFDVSQYTGNYKIRIKLVISSVSGTVSVDMYATDIHLQ